VVVQEAERKQQLAQAARQQWIASAPVIIVVGADKALLAAVEELFGPRWDRAGVTSLIFDFAPGSSRRGHIFDL